MNSVTNISVLALCFLALGPSFASAQVNHEYSKFDAKNGNAAVYFTDVRMDERGVYDGLRVYNSKSIQSSMFGKGWGYFPYATRLIEFPDGLIHIVDAGSGGRRRFLPVQEPGNSLESAKLLTVELRNMGEFSSENEEIQYLHKLQANEEFRSNQFQYYRSLIGKQNFNDTQVRKWTYKSKGRNEKIERTTSGYLRRYGSNQLATYDQSGNQVRIDYLNNQHFFSSEFDDRGRLRRINSSFGRSFVFSYGEGDSKLVEQIRSKDDVLTYRYNKKQHLTSVTDSRGETHSYSYDNNFNLTRIGYPNGTELSIEYEPKTQFVSRVREPDGKVSRFIYGSDPDNPNYHYWTEIENSKSRSKLPDRYEYWIKAIPETGIQYTQKRLVRVNDEETLTKFDEFNKPIFVRKGDVETTLKYDSELRLLKKESSDEKWLECHYDPIHKNLTRATTESGTTTFSYNEKGRLTYANEGGANEIEILHDSFGHIFELIGEQRILLKYGKFANRPVQIEFPNGTIGIDYDYNWKLKSLNSNNDPEALRKQIEPLQKILESLKPVGDNLNLNRLVELFSAESVDKLFEKSAQHLYEK